VCKCTRSGRDVQGRYISLDLRPASSKSNEKDYGGLNESHLFPNVMDELEVTVRIGLDRHYRRACRFSKE